MCASIGGHQDTVAVLLEYKAHVNLANKVRRTLRCKIMICPHIVNYGWVVDPDRGEIGGFNVYAFMQNDVTALALAVVAGYANIAKFLLENGATIDFEDEVRRTDMVMIILK